MITQGARDRSDKISNIFCPSFLLTRAPTVVAAVEVTQEKILAYVCLYFIALPVILFLSFSLFRKMCQNGFLLWYRVSLFIFPQGLKFLIIFFFILKFIDLITLTVLSLSIRPFTLIIFKCDTYFLIYTLSLSLTHLQCRSSSFSNYFVDARNNLEKNWVNFVIFLLLSFLLLMPHHKSNKREIFLHLYATLLYLRS